MRLVGDVAPDLSRFGGSFASVVGMTIGWCRTSPGHGVGWLELRSMGNVGLEKSFKTAAVDLLRGTGRCLGGL